MEMEMDMQMEMDRLYRYVGQERIQGLGPKAEKFLLSIGCDGSDLKCAPKFSGMWKVIRSWGTILINEFIP